MKGVSEVIAIILILMITIAIAGLAYTFMSSTVASTTSAASSAVTTTTSSMLTSFTIESMDIAKVYIRNTGQNALTNLSVYINDVPAHFNITPSVIAAGQIGTITIYDFIAEGDTIKITSPSGFSTSKKAPDPCLKAVGCWKFDEGSGLTAYDSSPYSNHGNLTNVANGTVSYTVGKFGTGLNFSTNGTTNGAYVLLPLSSSLNVSQPQTLTAWVKPNSNNQQNYIMARTTGDGTELFYIKTNGSVAMSLGNYTDPSILGVSGGSVTFGDWNFVSFTYAPDGNASVYINGILVGSIKNNVTNYGSLLGAPWKIGLYYYGASNFNGTIDEVRIYDRIIY